MENFNTGHLRAGMGVSNAVQSQKAPIDAPRNIRIKEAFFSNLRTAEEASCRLRNILNNLRGPHPESVENGAENSISSGFVYEMDSGNECLEVILRRIHCQCTEIEAISGN